MKQHPLSAIFPPLPEAELDALAEDIKAHGLRQSITIYEGQVLDGWHRWLACEKAGVNPRSIEYKGKDPAAFVRSENWHRRHLTASQRAAAIVALGDWSHRGKQEKRAPGALLPQTAAHMAKEAGVSERTIKQAKKVEESGSKDLKEAVHKGEVTVKRGAEIAKLPKKDQAKAMKAKPDPEADEHAPDLVKELERADKEIRSLQALVETLQSSDLAKQLTKAHLKYEQLEARLLQCNTTRAEAEKQARYQSGLLAKIRTALKVKKDSDILAALKA